nr:hypothetical protein [Tanacetum cinerariifolium]
MAPKQMTQAAIANHVTKDCRVKGKAIATGANTVPVR